MQSSNSLYTDHLSDQQFVSLFVQFGLASGRASTSASDQRHELGAALTQLLEDSAEASLREGHLLGDLVVHLC